MVDLGKATHVSPCTKLAFIAVMSGRTRSEVLVVVYQDDVVDVFVIVRARLVDAGSQRRRSTGEHSEQVYLSKSHQHGLR